MLEQLGTAIAVKDQRSLQQNLCELNGLRLNPTTPYETWMVDTLRVGRLSLEEGHFLEAARERVRARAASAPTRALPFMEWFENLKDDGPGQNDPLFDWLEKHCSLEEMKWFLTQEVAGEAGFEDLTAITQVKLPPRAKLELARNYWDEMGRGNAKGMHGPLLESMARHLELRPTFETTVIEAHVLANTMAGLAANRRYAYHSVGALGVIEMTAPKRAASVTNGLKRLGVGAEDRHYFSLHSVLDVKHSEAWNKEAIGPLVEDCPAIATAIAEGALMRLECGAACFAAYRRHFGLRS